MKPLFWILSFACSLPLAPQLTAGDWPTYRANASRDGFTADVLPTDLGLHWVWKSPLPPHSAWPRSDRMTFDRSFQSVIADGRVFFGSSADHRIHALDAGSGKTVWTFFTGGPVRFAPTVWEEKVYAVSDDGFLYCLDAATGTLVWKHRGGPDGRKILGNERMISSWPARGAPVILDGVLYFAAGIWPTDGIYLYALDPTDGKVLWENGKTGSIYMPQPHGNANANSGTSAQGYLMAVGDQLFVPTGRAVPAVFDRGTAELNYFHLQENTKSGGSEIMALGDVFYNSGLPFERATGKSRLPAKKKMPGILGRLRDGSLVQNYRNKLTAYQWQKSKKTDRKGVTKVEAALEPLWSVADVGAAYLLITAGDTVIAGGEDGVVGIDSGSQKIVWRQKVDGGVHGLAAADGQLLVSTDKGSVYCFGEKTVAQATEITESRQPYPPDPAIAAMADEIIAKSGVKSGFCLDLGCGDGALAYELVKRSDLYICGIESDPAKVALARKKLVAAGVYGNRVVIHQEELGQTFYPKYFADLIVSSRALKEGESVLDDGEVLRLQRPYGGIACLGKAGALELEKRGPLKGAGAWTHQYSNAANTGASQDTLVKGPLSMLWFRDVDVQMPNRHGRGPAPLFHQGRLIVEGIDELRAVSAYNGQVLWSYPLPGILDKYDADHIMGTSGVGSNFCVGEEGIYLRTGNHCLRIDAEDGKLLAKFDAPAASLEPTPAGKKSDGKNGSPTNSQIKQSQTWGYIACEQGILFGSVADTSHTVSYRWRPADMESQFTESGLFFARDAKTGEEKWRFKPQHSIRHNTIAIGGGRVYFIDRAKADADRQARRGEKNPHPHELGTLYCLDAENGEVLWKSDDNIWGTVLSLSVEDDALVMAYQPGSFSLPSELGGKIAVYQASSGKKLWAEQGLKYRTRPMIIDSKLYVQGGAWDLLSGIEQPFNLKRSYGCGMMTGSPNLLLFRSATLGYYDLTGSYELSNYGGIRPGCWINAIPAGGLVLMPDASARCTCSYLNRSWIALQGEE